MGQFFKLKTLFVNLETMKLEMSNLVHRQILARTTSLPTKYPQMGHGQGPGAEILNFETLSVNFEWGQLETWIDLGKSYLRNNKILQTGHGQGPGAKFLNSKPFP